MPGTQKSAVLWAQQKFQQKQFNLDRVQQLSLLKLHFVIWQLLTKRIETSFQWLHQSISTLVLSFGDEGFYSLSTNLQG